MMLLLKLLPSILALGTSAYALSGKDPTAKPGEYCAGLASAVERLNGWLRGKYTFCLNVDEKSRAQFVIKILSAEWRIDEEDPWTGPDEEFPLNVLATLVYINQNPFVVDEVDARAGGLTGFTTIRGKYLPEEITPRKHSYVIHCDERFPEVVYVDATIDDVFAFEIDAA